MSANDALTGWPHLIGCPTDGASRVPQQSLHTLRYVSEARPPIRDVASHNARTSRLQTTSSDIAWRVVRQRRVQPACRRPHRGRSDCRTPTLVPLAPDLRDLLFLSRPADPNAVPGPVQVHHTSTFTVSRGHSVAEDVGARGGVSGLAEHVLADVAAIDFALRRLAGRGGARSNGGRPCTPRSRPRPGSPTPS
jgi:hypothetical protein